MSERSKPLRNLTLAALVNMTAEEIAAFDAATLAQLHDEAMVEAETLKLRIEALTAGINLKYGARIRDARISQAKDTGVIRIFDNNVMIQQTVQKRVDWDQVQLANLDEKMRHAGDDPAVYMKVERKVSETAYAGWPEKVRTAFEPARTIHVSKAVWSFTPMRK